MFDKLKFWKNEEKEFDFGESGLGEQGVPEFGKDERGFGKEHESPAFGLEPGLAPEQSFTEEPAIPPAYNQPAPVNEAPAAFQQQGENISPDMLSKDLQLISSKLDTIKAQIEHMNQRIINIEKKAYEEEQKEGW
ncbi:MAG: hypothetical protein U9R34_07490 [Nanoarchaeota archaeon]|nr:hypothetical protein [Nanoarchaeota archaeon]